MIVLLIIFLGEQIKRKLIDRNVENNWFECSIGFFGIKNERVKSFYDAENENV